MDNVLQAPSEGYIYSQLGTYPRVEKVVLRLISEFIANYKAEVPYLMLTPRVYGVQSDD